jgi:2-polyprenyl-3-methyl-5-hydroxy-6-metoxy-1,4-benzoquinol methylase
MGQAKCYLCGCQDHRKRPGRVRDNRQLNVLECESCGLLFLSSFDHIAAGHYENSGMHVGNEVSVDDWLQEAEIDDERRYAFLRGSVCGATLLDFGCGAGGLLMKARHIAKKVVGVEPEARLAGHFARHGLTVFPSLDDVRATGERFSLACAFHVLEHLPDPRSALASLAGVLAKGGQMVIEVPSSADALCTLFGCSSFRDFTYWSQHLFLFNPATLARLVQQAGLTLAWIKQIQRYPLSNHLCWLAQGKPGGHKTWHFLDSPALHEAYSAQLAAIGATDTLLAGIEVP